MCRNPIPKVCFLGILNKKKKQCWKGRKFVNIMLICDKDSLERSLVCSKVGHRMLIFAEGISLYFSFKGLL